MSAVTVTASQRAQLLRPLNPRRVQKLDGFSHLAAYDVRAMLVRIFDFGGWSADLIELHPLYEQETQTKAGKPAFKVAYRATVRLTIHATGATYTEAAVGESTMPDFKRGDCHDMAIKTAESQAFKRCATNLGDQFGLGLYNSGSTDALVKTVLVEDEPAEAAVDEHVDAIAPEDEPVADDLPAEVLLIAYEAVWTALSDESLKTIWDQHLAHLDQPFQIEDGRVTTSLRAVILEAKAVLDGAE